MHDLASEYYALGGVTVRLIDPPQEIATAMSKAFSLSAVPASDTAVPLRCLFQNDLTFAERMPDHVRAKYQTLPDSEAPLAFYGPSGEFTVLVKNFGTATYAVTGPDDGIVLYVQRPDRGDAIIHFQAVVVPVIKQLLLRQGKLLVHSGCVAAPDGRAVLFVGHSGSGKTTSCLSLTRAGFQFVSDDLNVLSFENGIPCVEGIREKMNLSRRTIGFFPELAHLAEVMDRSQEYRWKLPVSPDELWGDERVRSKAAVAAVIVTHIGKDGPRLAHCRVADLLNLILQNQRFETGLPISGALMQVLWNILERSRTLHLFTGPDPVAMGEFMAGQFLSGTGSEAGSVPLAAGPPAPAPPAVAVPGPPGAFVPAMALRGVLAHTLDGDSNGFIVEAFRTEASAKAEIVRLFSYHRLEGHLARWIRDVYPVDDFAGFSAERTLAHARAYALYVEQAAVTLHRALADGRIPHLFLRGPAIAAAYFPDRTLRTYRDLDIVLPRPLLDKAAGMLQDLGYRPNRDLGYWERMGEWPFSNGTLIVELHWHAYPLPFSERPELSVERLLAATDTVSLEGVPLACLPPEHLLLSSLLHAAYDHHLDRLVRLVDIRQILVRAGGGMDWDWIARQVRETASSLAVAKEAECLASFLEVPHLEDLQRGLKVPRSLKRLADAVLPPAYLLRGRDRFDRMRRTAFRGILKISGT